jgi:hypothetical protein
MVMRMRKARRLLDVFFLEALSAWNLERVVRPGARFLAPIRGQAEAAADPPLI